MGIKAYCSDMIIDPDDIIFFMSICGYQVTVKGLIANFLEHNGISIKIDGTEHYLSRHYLGYKVQMKKLPSGLSHAIIFPELTLPKIDDENPNSFIIFASQNDDLINLFYRHLDEKTDIPLHPTWSKWLWKTFKQQKTWIQELTTLSGNYKGYFFNFNPNQLYDLITIAIQSKVPEITECLEKKGKCHG